MRYRIQTRKQKNSNLTTYTLQKYLVRSTPLIPFWGLWLNFATTSSKSRSEEWRQTYNVRL